MVWIITITSCVLLGLTVAAILCKGERSPLPLGGSEQNQTLIVLAVTFIIISVGVTLGFL